MILIVPDPINGPEATITIIHDGDTAKVTAKVELLPQSKLLNFTSPFEPGAAKRRGMSNGMSNGKPEPLYKKKFTGRRAEVPPHIRQWLAEMPYTELEAFAKRIGSKTAYLSVLIREPSRGIATKHLQAILAGFDDGAAPATETGTLPELQPLES